MKYLALTLMMVLTLTGCGLMYDSDECPAADSDSVSLSFSLFSSGAVLYSRADNQKHDEVSSEFRYFEDGIDVNDLAVFVFAKISGDDKAPEKLVYKLTDLTKTDDPRIAIVGAPGDYVVEVMIRRQDLKEVLGGYEITPAGNENISFRMLMLANCSSPGTNAAAKWDEITGQDYEAVIEQLDKWNFAMSYIYNPNTTSNDITEIYKNRKDHVPMFGTKMFDPVSEDALFYSRPENRVYLGEIDLLRALAKVRVVDNIEGKVGDYPKITAVSFLSSQDEAHQLPYDAANYKNGQQIHTPRISVPGNQINVNNPLIYRLGILPESWSLTPASQRTGDVFVGFVPEQPINDDIHPFFRITITDRKADGTFDNLTYDVPMTKYLGQEFSFGSNILRNHIYTLSVNSFGTKLDCTVDLAPYRSCVLEPFFGIDRDD